MITFGSLFAGIGGFDLGFERAGMSCAWQVEIDNKCNEVLAYYWPDVQRYGDVKDVGKRNLHNLPYVDIISFGTPCQDLSVAGKRKGLRGERSGLFFEAIRIVDELKPAFAVWENVPGAFSSNSGRDFTTVLSAFQKCGARDIAWRVLDAQYFGVAQRRRRIFLVADFRGERAAEVLFECESSAWDSPPSRKAREKPAYALAASVRGTGDGHGQGWNSNYVFGVSENQRAELRLTPYSRQITTGGGKPGQGYPCVLTTSDPDIVQHALSGHNQRLDPDGEHFVIARPLAFGQTIDHYDESQQTYVTAWNWQSGGDVRHSFGLPNLQAHQVPAVGVRRLTPTECERLQGFPDSWTAVNGMKDTARYRMLGNAVCVPVAEWIAQRIVRQDSV